MRREADNRGSQPNVLNALRFGLHEIFVLVYQKAATAMVRLPLGDLDARRLTSSFHDHKLSLY